MYKTQSLKMLVVMYFYIVTITYRMNFVVTIKYSYTFIISVHHRSQDFDYTTVYGQYYSTEF